MSVTGIDWRMKSHASFICPPGPRMGGVKSLMNPSNRKACHGCLCECVPMDRVLCEPCWEAVPDRYRKVLANVNPPAHMLWGRWDRAISGSRTALKTKWKKRGITHKR